MNQLFYVLNNKYLSIKVHNISSLNSISVKYSSAAQQIVINHRRDDALQFHGLPKFSKFRTQRCSENGPSPISVLALVTHTSGSYVSFRGHR